MLRDSDRNRIDQSHSIVVVIIDCDWSISIPIAIASIVQGAYVLNRAFKSCCKNNHLAEKWRDKDLSLTQDQRMKRCPWDLYGHLAILWMSLGYLKGYAVWGVLDNFATKLQSADINEKINESKREILETNFINVRSHRKWLKHDCFLTTHTQHARDTSRNNCLCATCITPPSAVN